MLNITTETFATQVTGSPKTVLLDFWATWCPPCRAVAPVLEALAQKRPDIVVGKVDVDAQPQLAQQFGIRFVPTLVVMRQGVEVARETGVKSLEQLEALIDQ